MKILLKLYHNLVTVIFRVMAIMQGSCEASKLKEKMADSGKALGEACDLIVPCIKLMQNT